MNGPVPSMMSWSIRENSHAAGLGTAWASIFLRSRPVCEVSKNISPSIYQLDSIICILCSNADLGIRSAPYLFFPVSPSIYKLSLLPKITPRSLQVPAR